MHTDFTNGSDSSTLCIQTLCHGVCWALSLWLSISHATYIIQGVVRGEDKGQPWRGLVHLRVPSLVPLGSPVYLLKTHGPMTVLIQLTINIDWWRVTGKLGILPWRFSLTSGILSLWFHKNSHLWHMEMMRGYKNDLPVLPGLQQQRSICYLATKGGNWTNSVHILLYLVRRSESWATLQASWTIMYILTGYTGDLYEH